MHYYGIYTPGYLGVQIEAKPGSLYYKEYEQVILKKAKKYLNLIRIKSRAFPDPGYAVYHLWHSVALPSILYGIESTAISVRTQTTLESIHARVGKFILQVPKNTQNICAVVGCEFTPLHILQMDRMYGLVSRLQESASGLVQEVMQVAEEQGIDNLFFRKFAELNADLADWEGYVTYRQQLCDQYVEEKLMLVQKTTFMFMPSGSLQLGEPPYSLMEAELVGDMNRFMFLNAGLGNRSPTKTGVKFKVCVACALQGLRVSMNEIHLILGCPRYELAREHLGIMQEVRRIVGQYGEGEEGYGIYWGKGQGLRVEDLTWRLQCAMYLRDYYLQDVLVLKPIYYRYEWVIE